MIRRAPLILLLCLAVLCLDAVINRIEYYFDTDPGQGNATSLAFTGTDVATVNAEISTQGLPPGLHILAIRARDGSGTWSMESRKQFVKLSPGNSSIVRLEYFIDTDPGAGNGTALAISPAGDIVYLDTINLEGIGSGLHKLCLRAKNSQGFWSQIATRMVWKVPLERPDLAGLRYYFDADSSNAVLVPAIPLNGDPATTEMAFVIDPVALGVPAGMHVLNLVATDENGSTSMVQRRLFYLQPEQRPELVRIEWYFTGADADPEQIFWHPLTPGDDVSDALTASLTHLSQDGQYQMHIYGVNAIGQASLEEIYPFTVNFIPQNLLLEINGTQLTLSWDAIPGASGYKLRKRSEPYETGTESILTGTQHQESVTGKAFYEVRAFRDERGVTGQTRR